MTKGNILERILTNAKWLAREDVFKKTFPDAYKELHSWAFPDTFSFSQKLYHYLHNDNELKLGLCRVCRKRCSFTGISRGYRPTCSNKCNTTDDIRKQKAVETSLVRYGTEHPAQAEKVKEKTKETCREKYGCNHPMQNNTIKEKTKATCLEKYGTEHYLQSEDKKEKSLATCLEKYGCNYPSQSNAWKESFKKSCVERYGAENPSQSEDIRKKISNAWKQKDKTEIARIVEKERSACLEKYGTNSYSKTNEYKDRIVNTSLERYGTEHPAQAEKVKEKTKETCRKKYGCEYALQSEKVKEKRKRTNVIKYGTECALQSNEIKEKIHQTCIERYGVEWACMRPEARNYKSKSKTNIAFSKSLVQNNIEYEMEYPLDSYSYDFKVNNTLIEINPTITHNSFLNIFGGEPKASNYHLNKTECAIDNGYHCIHIWDWDDVNKIVNMMKPKQTLYARVLEIREVNADECNAFLNAYHLQNACMGQSIRLGLYNNNVLVELMTFGKPRYNRNYEYELLRLCSHSDYIIVGGAERLFRHFVEHYKPTSVISYCDASKFNGEVYRRLGFSLKDVSSPSKHWYNLKTQQHITDNLLRQRGFDQLFNANYGKGTDNEELMLEHGFLPVYDCGQMRFEWKANV